MKPFDFQRLPVVRPTNLTLHLRQNVLWQFWRFCAVNIRMLMMIFKSHDHAA